MHKYLSISADSEIYHTPESLCTLIITLSQLSSYSGYSQSYLSSVFKERTGHSPLAYFNLLKVRHACQLLDSTDMKLNCICHMVGISDPYYFSRLFSKVMGMSPSSYRKRPDI
ncbi:MAG: helix-turn-helix domain-containing protein [Muribaculaceae bacterium]|nr:helix-turn-helix domain-containing protein [Muribaculaceae bacterium]MDE6533209.1 helix-turn-helix domain-containing protein [Muribaculaceae bacterium]